MEKDMLKDQTKKLYLIKDGIRSQQIKKDFHPLLHIYNSIFTNLCSFEDQNQEDGQEEKGKPRFA